MLLSNHVLYTKYCLLVTKDFYNGDTLILEIRNNVVALKEKLFILPPAMLIQLCFYFLKNILPKSDSHLLNSSLHNEVICKYNSSLFHKRKTFVKINILPLLQMNYLDTYSNSYFQILNFQGLKKVLQWSNSI